MERQYADIAEIAELRSVREANLWIENGYELLRIEVASRPVTPANGLPPGWRRQIVYIVGRGTDVAPFQPTKAELDVFHAEAGHA